jgi:pimeloyl-ACP methyl ester carboxylesterase
MTGTRTQPETRHRAPEHPRTRLVADLPVTERRLELEGVSTSFLEGGEGSPLVVLHGPGEFAARWVRVLPGMTATHRVIVPDLPGHGASGVRDRVLTPEGIIAWLDALIGRTCGEPPVLVGHILGGAVAARYAVARPGRLRALVLVDSLGLAPFRPSPRFALALITFMALPGEGTYGRFMRHCEYDRDALASEAGDTWDAVRDYSLERARDARGRSAMRALMKGVGVPPIPGEDLAAIRVPTALIWGRHDKALRLSVAEKASERYGWPLHIVEDTADDAPFERPGAFLRALRAALGTDAAVTPDATV